MPGVARSSSTIQLWDHVLGTKTNMDTWIARELDRIGRQVQPRHCQDYEALTMTLENIIHIQEEHGWRMTQQLQSQLRDAFSDLLQQQHHHHPLVKTMDDLVDGRDIESKCRRLLDHDDNAEIRLWISHLLTLPTGQQEWHAWFKLGLDAYLAAKVKN